jgi:hypothetical protein
LFAGKIKSMQPVRKKLHADKKAILIAGRRKKLKKGTPVKDDSWPVIII